MFNGFFFFLKKHRKRNFKGAKEMYLVVIFVVVVTFFFVAVAEDTWVSETVVQPSFTEVYFALYGFVPNLSHQKD